MMHATAVTGIARDDPNFPTDYAYGFNNIVNLARSNAVQSFTNADTLTCKSSLQKDVGKASADESVRWQCPKPARTILREATPGDAALRSPEMTS